MRALMVFESMFGNAQTIADEIANGVATHMAVDVVEVSQAPVVVDANIDLLIVGGPTHQLGLSRPGSRQEAARQADRPLVSGGIGLREWLEAVRTETTATTAAAFSTRLAKPRWLNLFGSAERHIEKRLRRLGFRMAPATHFYVAGTRGPLLEGEHQRARRWGEQLALDVVMTLRDSQAA